MNFQRYYYKLYQKQGNGITFVDVDGTLFHSKAKINVVKNGKAIHQLGNVEFRGYQLNPGESFDFGEFADAKFFRKTSDPIKPVINRLKKILDNIQKGSRESRVVILTARASFDDMDEFKRTFRDHGVDVDRLEIRTVGDKPGNAPEKKKAEVREFLKSGKYQRARMFDDTDENLTAFVELQQEFPDVQFHAIKVLDSGKAVEVEA